MRPVGRTVFCVASGFIRHRSIRGGRPVRKAKKRGERYSFRQAMGLVAQPVQTVLYGKPALHAECGGALEIENCRGILQYDAQRLRLDMGQWTVTIEGDGLVVENYQKTMMTVRGQVFSVHFGYGGVP